MIIGMLYIGDFNMILWDSVCYTSYETYTFIIAKYTSFHLLMNPMIGKPTWDLAHI